MRLLAVIPTEVGIQEAVAVLLEIDGAVEKWVRLSNGDIHIQYEREGALYVPDFVVETGRRMWTWRRARCCVFWGAAFRDVLRQPLRMEECSRPVVAMQPKHSRDGCATFFAYVPPLLHGAP